VKLYPKETDLPEYKNLKRVKLENRGESLIVQEPAFMDYKSEFRKMFKPTTIKEKLIPRLTDIISKSNGRYDSYVIWPEFMVEDDPDSV
jgi:hypothetical protein